MKVATLITCTNEKYYRQCTLALDYLRVGFPTADIWVYENYFSYRSEETRNRVRKFDYHFNKRSKQVHHANFIRECVECSNEPLFIVDPDTIYWSSCEGLVNERTGYFRGMFTPEHWCPWADGVHYAARFHTAFLYFPNPRALVNRLRCTSPLDKLNSAYRPFDPFMPFTVFSNGVPVFYDTCANLFHSVGGEHLRIEHLDCFDHINSASFYDTAMALLPECQWKDDLRAMHRLAVDDPTKLKGYYRSAIDFYHQQNKVLCQRYQTNSHLFQTSVDSQS